MKDSETDTTPISLIDSIYNIDSHQNNSYVPIKRNGILPYSTSLSKNMKLIAILYSKCSTSKQFKKL